MEQSPVPELSYFTFMTLIELWLRSPATTHELHSDGSISGQEQSSVATVHSPVRSSHPCV